MRHVSASGTKPEMRPCGRRGDAAGISPQVVAALDAVPEENARGSPALC
jgi:hypothetical protein